MKPSLWAFAAAVLLIGVSASDVTFAQKPGGILRVYHWDSPPSMSIHEEAQYSTVVPMMGVFNNLVMYKQDEPKNSLELLSRGRLARSIRIINGLVPGNLTRALNGEPIGTIIHGARRPGSY